MNSRIRYTVANVLSNKFYQLPKFLFEGEFKGLSSDARILYSFLKERHELSVKNQWYNNKGEVYLIMTREHMCELLNVSMKPAIKAVNELKRHNLLEEERRGQGKPNLIYLLEYKIPTPKKPNDGDKKSTDQDMSNDIFRDDEMTSPYMADIQPSNTNQNQTNSNNTNLSINQTSEDNQDNNNTMRLNDINSIKKEVAEKINLGKLLNTYPQHNSQIREMYGIMADTLSSTKKSFRISKEELPAHIVKEIFSKIEYQHFIYALEGLVTNNTKIKNIKSYILTTLYNTTKTIGSYNAMNEQHERYSQQKDQYSTNPETSPYTKNSYTDDRIQFKTFDLEHFFNRAVECSMKR